MAVGSGVAFGFCQVFNRKLKDVEYTDDLVLLQYDGSLNNLSGSAS